MSEQNEIVEPQSDANPALDMGNLLRNLFNQPEQPKKSKRSSPKKTRRVSESDEESEEQDCESVLGDDDVYEQEQRWEAFNNLVENHKKLCDAFVLLIKNE
jgi:hypothetical protein